MKHDLATSLALLFALHLANFGAAQTAGCRIRVEAKNCDSLWLGESFGRRAVVAQAMQKTAEGVFEIRLKNPPDDPCQAIVYEPSPGAKKAFLTVLLPPEGCDLDLSFDAKTTSKPPVFKNSTENERFWQYSQQVDALLKTRDDRNNDWRLHQNEPALAALRQAEKALLEYQETFFQNAPQSCAARVARPYFFKIPPEPSSQLTMGGVAAFRQNWFRSHFFDGADIASESFWCNPLGIDWLDVFTFKTAMPSPDSVRWHADEAFRRLAPNPSAQHYYLNYMLNSFEKMSRFGFDETFIYLVDDYVKTEKTDGYSRSSRTEKVETAEKIERLRIGKTLPNATLFDEGGAPVALGEIEADFLLLMFFQPDCSHCKKEVPIVKRMAEKYRADGLKVVLVCGRPGDNLTECWRYRTAQTLPDDWLMLADGKGKSRFRSLYNIDGYPRLFLLDKNKTILYRRGGSATEAELEKVFSIIHETKK